MSTWVFLRGLMREQRHWGAFPAIFRQAVAGARIVTPDLPGNGRHHRQDSARHVAEMVDMCRRDLAGQGCTAPYRILALSLGGMVAVEWAARYPDEIAALVLVNTSMRPFSPFYRRLRWQNYGAILALAARGGVARQERLILRLTSNDAGGRAALLPRWIGFQREYPVSRANALRQLLSAARYRAPPTPPCAPVLVLASSADRLVDARCSLRLAERWDVPCALHPSAGHDLPMDDGAWVAAQVARWLRAGCDR